MRRRTTVALVVFAVLVGSTLACQPKVVEVTRVVEKVVKETVEVERMVVVTPTFTPTLTPTLRPTPTITPWVIVERIEKEVTKIVEVEKIVAPTVESWCDYELVFIDVPEGDLQWVTVFEERGGITLHSYTPLRVSVARISTNFPCPDKLIVWTERESPWGQKSIEINLPKGFNVVDVCLATGDVGVYPGTEKEELECPTLTRGPSRPPSSTPMPVVLQEFEVISSTTLTRKV